MLKYYSLGMAALVLGGEIKAGNFASEVTSYNPGTGFAVDFATKEGYTRISSVLGEPARVTPGDFGGPVDPFNSPYQIEQLISLGVGGSLTIRFEQPVANDPAHPFGVDFLIHGSAGFTIVNGDFSGGGITDGSIYSNNEGSTRVSVSADGSTFYTLNPSLAPVVDGFAPTDGSGNFGVPLDPALRGADFNGKGMAGIRGLYNGSAGGSGYDLAWAVDGSGKAVQLDAIQFVKVDVLTGRSEIDAFVGAVPEPGVLALGSLGMVLLLSRAKRSRTQV